MPKGIPNKRYTGEFKQKVVETMMREKLSYTEAARQFEVSNHQRVASWERIYLEEGPQGLYVERRGRGSKGRPPKKLKPEVEEDLLADAKANILCTERLLTEDDVEKAIPAGTRVFHKVFGEGTVLGYDDLLDGNEVMFDKLDTPRTIGASKLTVL